MAIAITEDFVTKGGLIVQGTGTVTTSSVVLNFQTGTFQVAGGAAIAKNLIVGTSATIWGDLITVNGTVLADLRVAGDSILTTLTANGVVSITDSTAATIGGSGALKVTGGILANKNIVVASTLTSTSTVANNALYVAGGVGIAKSLVVSGTALFQSDVVFSGATTNVFSTNTFYTDNLIELHVPSTAAWTLDDGRDIGLRFHYYANSAGQNGALVLANDTKYLEWYDTGAESTTGTFTAATYGTFKTGNIIVAGTDTAITAQSGALQVVGGVGIGKDLYVGGVISASTFSGYLEGLTSTATNIAGGATGSILYQSTSGVTTSIPIGGFGQILSSDGTNPAWYPLSTVPVEYATTATYLRFGDDMQIPYQTDVGKTAFAYNLRYDYTSKILRTVNVILTGTTNATSTISGALQIVGGAGIGQDLWVGGNQVILGDIDVRGGDIITNKATFNLVNTVATTVNFAGSATALTIGDVSGYTKVQSTTVASSTLTGALRVAGGVGIQGDVYIGGTTNFSGNLIPSNSSVSLGTALLPFADLFLGPNSLYVDTIKLSGSGSAFKAESATGPVTFTAGGGVFTLTTNASSTITGALQVAGGVGVGLNLWVGGNQVILGDIDIRGGDITTNQTTFNLVNTNATTVNIAGAATTTTIGSLSGFTKIQSTTAASSTNTGALQVVGGVGIGGNIYVGGNQVVLGDIEIRGGDITTDQTTFNLVNTNATTVNIAGAATTTTIGSLSGSTKIQSTTVSTSTTTGALQVVGGVGIGGALYVSSIGYVNNAVIVTTATLSSQSVVAITAGTDTAVSTSTGSILIWNTSTLQSITNRGSSTTNIISITNITAASSTITGALRVSGGVGIGGRLYVGDRLTISSTLIAASTITGALVVSGGVGIGGNLYVGGNIIGVITTATNISGGAAGQIHYQSATGITGFSNAGTAGQLLISQGTSAPLFVNTTSFTIGYSANVAGGDTGSLLYQSSPSTTNFIGIGSAGSFLRSNGTTATFVTTASMYVGAAVTATNVVGGAVGSMIYQSAPGTTTMLPIGTGGYLLTSNGSAPEWTALSGLSAGTATNVAITNDVTSATTHYIAFMNTTTGDSGVRTSGPTKLTYVPNTGDLGVGGSIRIASNTAASSTITGALQVVGGVGIGGNIYVGGDITTNQTTFNLVNTNATTVNIAGAGTTVSIGASTGNTNVKNNLIVTGNLTVQGTTTIVDSTVTNIVDPIITLGGLANNAPYVVADSKDKGIAFKYWGASTSKVGFFGYNESTGAFTYLLDASITNEIVSGTTGAIEVNLYGGTLNSLVYQSAPNVTSFLANASTSGYVLSSIAGSVPSWASLSSLGAGSATTATHLASGTAGQVPYQTSPGQTSFFGPGTTGNILVSNGTSAPAYQNTLTLAGTTAATNTTTGALQVKGGVGVGGNIYSGNRIGWTSATNVSAVYQYYNAATNSLDTVFG